MHYKKIPISNFLGHALLGAITCFLKIQNMFAHNIDKQERIRQHNINGNAVR